MTELGLASPPQRLTPGQRAAFVTIALVCAATRFAARARTPWEWDEVLFLLGMRDFDVMRHQPHPPGFPLFIALGHVVRQVVGDDFRSLQWISLIAGMALFPAIFFLARECRLSFRVSLIAGLLCAFFPNVLFYGGTAFSDLPSIVLVVIAAALLLRGCRSAEAYLVGAALLAVAVGFRPQNFLIGFLPGVLATLYRWKEGWRDVVLAAIVGATIVGATYGFAAIASGDPQRYVDTVRLHGDYISRVDSYRSPLRPPLWRLFDRFFIFQYQSRALSVVASVFALIGCVFAVRDRSRPIALAVGMFTPFAIAAWLMLDRFSVSRFSIGYIPMFAILIAYGIDAAFRWRPILAPVAGMVLAASFLAWTLPALRVVRETIAPPLQAVQALRTELDLDRSRDDLFVAHVMIPFVNYFDPAADYIRVMDERAMPLSAGVRRAWLLTELDWTSPEKGWIYRRPHDRLWNIARRHYFDVALTPVEVLPQFGFGWYTPERAGLDEWRWMGRRSSLILPAANRRMKLRFLFGIPGELTSRRPTLTIRVNGKVIDRFRTRRPQVGRDYLVTPTAQQPVRVEIETTHALSPSANDPRELGLILRQLSWGPG